jgi:hypothetical protein
VEGAIIALYTKKQNISEYVCVDESFMVIDQGLNCVTYGKHVNFPTSLFLENPRRYCMHV